MKLKNLYLFICFLSVILIYWPLSIFINDYGFNMVLLFEQLFSTPATTFFGMDLLVVSAVILIFIIFEGKRLQMKKIWLPILATFVVGISLALPLFLYLRENHLTNKPKNYD